MSPKLNNFRMGVHKQLSTSWYVRSTLETLFATSQVESQRKPCISDHIARMKRVRLTNYRRFKLPVVFLKGNQQHLWLIYKQCNC